MILYYIKFIFIYLSCSYICLCDYEYEKKSIERRSMEEIIDYYKDAITKTNDAIEVLDLKIKIGDCYFDNREYDSSYECYKSILSQYQNFNKKDKITYKLCLSLYNQCPHTYDVSLKNVEILSKYIEYYKQNFPDGDYLNDILKIEEKINLLLILNDVSIIKYYFENKIFNSAIFCCDIFLKKYEKKYDKYINIFSEVYILKLKSKYEIVKKLLISANRNKNLYHIFFKNISELYEMLGIYEKKNELCENNKKEFDILYDKCYFLLNKFYEPEKNRRRKERRNRE